MVLMRLLLVLMAILSLAGFGGAYYAISNIESIGLNENIAALCGVISVFLISVTPFMLLSSLVMLALSFLRVEEKDGLLVYDSRSFYWRLMSKFFRWEAGESISLCKAFWQTTFILFIVSFFIYASIGLVFIVGNEGLSGLLKILAFFGSIGLYLLFLNSLDKISRLKTEAKKGSVRVLAHVLQVAFISALIGFGVYFLLKLVLLVGLITIAYFIGCVLLALLILGLLFGAIEFLPKDNVLTMMYYMLKENLCPVISPKKAGE